MFLYRKGNQSFGMCKQKGEKNIKKLDFARYITYKTKYILKYTLDKSAYI